MKPNEIKKLRTKLGITKEEFGELFAVGGSQILRWEDGRSEPPGVKVKLLETLKARADRAYQLGPLDIFDVVEETFGRGAAPVRLKMAADNYMADARAAEAKRMKAVQAGRAGGNPKDSESRRKLKLALKSILEAARDLSPLEIKDLLEYIKLIKKRRNMKA